MCVPECARTFLMRVGAHVSAGQNVFLDGSPPGRLTQSPLLEPKVHGSD